MCYIDCVAGGSQEGYVKWMCRAVAASGWRACVLNYRGCAGLPLTSPKCYDAVSTGDVRAAIVHIRRYATCEFGSTPPHLFRIHVMHCRHESLCLLTQCVCRDHPTAQLFAVGYSLGAILLTKYTADADSLLFAPLSSPSGTSLQPPPVSPNLQQPLSPPSPSVASCATPESPAGKHPLPANSSPDRVHTPRVVGPDMPAAANWWQQGRGSHGSNSRSTRRGWDWKSCTASWPASLGHVTTGTADKSVPVRHSAHHGQHPTSQRSASTNCRNGAARGGLVRDSKGMGEHFSSEGRTAGDLGSGLTAVVAISSPFELVSASARLHQPWTMPWLYNLILTARLKLYVRKHSGKISLAPDVQLEDIYASTTLREFDAAGTCKALGFETAHDYYVHGSSENYIPSIRTPFLFVSSQDDPFLGDLRTSVKQVLENPSTAIALTQSGGHCAHLMVRSDPFYCTVSSTSVSSLLVALDM